MGGEHGERKGGRIILKIPSKMKVKNGGRDRKQNTHTPGGRKWKEKQWKDEEWISSTATVSGALPEL